MSACVRSAAYALLYIRQSMVSTCGMDGARHVFDNRRPLVVVPSFSEFRELRGHKQQTVCQRVANIVHVVVLNTITKHHLASVVSTTMSVGAAELALIVVQYLEHHGCHQSATTFRRCAPPPSCYSRCTSSVAHNRNREAQQRICPLPAVCQQLRSLDTIVDEYMLLKLQRDRLQNLSSQHPVLGSIITTLNLYAGSAAVAATPMHAVPPATDAAPAPRPPAHPGHAQHPGGVTPNGGPNRQPVAAKSSAVDLESTGKTPAQEVDVVWTVRKERRKRSRGDSESDAPRLGARKSLKYEGSQQETVGGGCDASKCCQSAPSPAPRPIPPAAAPSPPPAASKPNLAGNAVIRALQQQQVVGNDAAAPAPLQHMMASSHPPTLALPLLGGDTFGGMTNLFAGDSLFGEPPPDTGPEPRDQGSPDQASPDQAQQQPTQAHTVSQDKENSEPSTRKASQAAIEAFLGTITNK